MKDPKTGIHEPTVTIPWWLDCRKPYGFNVELCGRDKAVWRLIIPMYVSILTAKGNK